MTPHKQLFSHDPANNVMGDCYRTAIACLLDVEPSSVPHFYGNAACTDDEVKRHMQEWLAGALGLQIVTINFNDQTPIKTLIEFVSKWNPGLNFLFSGMSERGTSHVVVCRDGKMVHDPHPSDAGVTKPYEGGAYVIEFLAPIALFTKAAAKPPATGAQP